MILTFYVYHCKFVNGGNKMEVKEGQKGEKNREKVQNRKKITVREIINMENWKNMEKKCKKI